MYRVLDEPVLYYASGIWGINRYKEVEAVQNRACRLFLGASKNVPNLSLRGDVAWLEFNKRKAKVRGMSVKCRLSSAENDRILYKLHSASLNTPRSWETRLKKLINDLDIPTYNNEQIASKARLD